MGASRLPGKVLADIHGWPALGRLVRRLRRSQRVDDIVVATSQNPQDDPVASWAAQEGVACHRGSEDDVLARVVGAQRQMHSDIVVEVCGDTPLIDPEVIDMAVDTFFANDCDVVSNTAKLSFPQGIDAQVFRLRDLEEVADTVQDAAVREHVSLHFYEHPERYRIVHLAAPPRWAGAQYRFQLDYPEDLQFIRAVYGHLEPTHGEGFGTGEILDLLRQLPQLATINRDCVEKPAR